MNQAVTSTFDPQAFVDMQVSDANDTVLLPVPVGEYTAVAEKVDVAQWQSKDGSKAGVKLVIQWSIDDANVKTFMGRDTVLCRQDIMLDTTPQGSLDMGKGKNVGLGKLRAALGKNTPGVAFSFSQIPGSVAKVKVDQRSDPQDAEKIYSEVKGVAAA